MTSHAPIPLLLSLLLCACGGGSDSTSSSAATTAAAASVDTTSRSNIAALIYNDTQRTPTDFYQEASISFNGYVATSHLTTTDINPSAVLRYELCSNDYAQALTWSESYNAANDHAALVSAQITDHYFEFDRLKIGSPNGYLRQRIYNCAYLSRATVDLNASSGAAGMLNVRPLSAAQLQQLSEYLWQFTHYNNFGNVVLSSSRASDTSGLTHTLQIATLSRATDTGCDTINVVNWTHHVDTSSGELQVSITPQYSFMARESGSNVSLCN